MPLPIDRTTQRPHGPMKVAAVVGWLAAVIGGVGAIVVRLVNPAPILPNTFGLGEATIVAFAVQAITFASVGALLVQRRPDNAVGRVLILCGTGYALGILAGVLTFVAAVESPHGPAASVGGWLSVVLSFVGAASLPYLAFIFPTGRPHNAKWERLQRFHVGGMIAVAIILSTQPGPIQLFPGITNPFGIGPDFRLVLGERALAIVTASGGVGVAALAILAVVSRYRGAGSVERQQLKWFISAAVASLACFTVTSSSALQPEGARGELPAVIFGLTGATVPVAIGIAILRYRLYDIDRLIARTLAYGAVTAVLGGIYAAVVVAVGALLGSFAQGGTVAVAAATLIVFAVFGPVRHRAQLIVDRRFDRSRFDAAQTLARMTARLRDEVDPGRIESDIVVVIGETFHPAHARVWLRAPVAASPPSPTPSGSPSSTS